MRNASLETPDRLHIYSAEDVTDYHIDGKTILADKKVGKPFARVRNPKFYTLEKKTQAACLYAVYGDIDEVATIVCVPAAEIREWKQESWWHDIQKQVYIEQNEHLSVALHDVLQNSLAQLKDRLENGDPTYNAKTGKFVNVPVPAKTLINLFNSFAHQRRLTAGEPTSINANVGVQDRLKGLEEAFLRFAQAKTIENSTD